MYVVAKTKKERAFVYSNKFAIACNSKQQADKLAIHLNNNNGDSVGDWKLKSGEIYFVYEVDKYSKQPLYKIKTTKNYIKVVYNV